MIEQAGESVLLIDHSKLSARGLSAIAPISAVETTRVTGLDEAQADALRLGGRPSSAAERRRPRHLICIDQIIKRLPATAT